MHKKRVFDNPLVLQTMISLRLQGWTIHELSIIFGCNKTSIRKACIRNNIPNRLYIIPRPEIRFIYVPKEEDGERINIGKSYKEYLKELKKGN